MLRTYQIEVLRVHVGHQQRNQRVRPKVRRVAKNIVARRRKRPFHLPRNAGIECRKSR